MKAPIFSDSHGCVGNMLLAAERERDYDMIMFAGDVHRDAEELSLMLPQKCIAEVLGNNDFFVKSVPFDRVFTFGGKKIFLTHGHHYGVKYGAQGLVKKALEEGADICIYGHTHIRDNKKCGGLTLINPGAASRSYAVLTVNNDEISVELKYI